MIIVKPSAELLWITPNAEHVIEAAGRTAYKSEDKITNDSSKRFIRMIIKSGHGSVLEHASLSFRFVTDRGISHELVRHRICSFTQESSRYCSYNKKKFDEQIRVIEPPFKLEGSRILWKRSCEQMESDYLNMTNSGENPEIARSVLPTCLKTEIVMTCNFREFFHILQLRLDGRAHPQIRQLILMAWEIANKKCPSIFGVYEDLANRCREGLIKIGLANK